MSHPKNDTNALKIYIDGSAFGKNPGDSCGFAGIIEYPEPFNKENKKIFECRYSSSNNNRMELLACIKALEYIKDNARELSLMGVCRIIIVSDSKYVVDNQHYPNIWRKAGWVNLEGKPIENIDLWKKFLTVRGSLSAEIVWDKGKTSVISKDIDAAAKNAAQNLRAKPDLGYREGKVQRSLVGKAACLLYSANNQTEVIRVYRYAPKGNKNNLFYKVDFDLYDSMEKKFNKKYSAYIKDESMIHRAHYYKATFNGNPEFPIIEKVQEINLDLGLS